MTIFAALLVSGDWRLPRRVQSRLFLVVRRDGAEYQTLSGRENLATNTLTQGQSVKRRLLPLLAVLFSCFGTCLLAQDPPAPQGAPDQLTLKNGDKISGTFKSLKNSKVSFESPQLGKLSVKLGDIQEITTSGPVTILTKAGETVTRPIAGIQDLTGAKAISVGKKPPVVWSGSVALGGSYQSGNTEKRIVTAQADFERRTENTRLSGNGSVLYEEEKSSGEWNLTDRVYRGRLQHDYFLDKKSYLFVFVAGERDALADLDLRLAIGSGYGYQWYETDEFKFSTELGVSYLREDLHNPSDTDEYVAARLRSNLVWQVTSDIKFLQDTMYFQSLEESDDINMLADSRLRMSLTETMFTQLQWIFEYDNTPAQAADRVDHTVLLSVGVTF